MSLKNKGYICSVRPSQTGDKTTIDSCSTETGVYNLPIPGPQLTRQNTYSYFPFPPSNFAQFTCEPFSITNLSDVVPPHHLPN